MNDLKVAAIQADLVWENPVENRAYFYAQFRHLANQNIDLVVLPEMFTTGFSMTPERLEETMQGETISWMLDCAKTFKFLLTGSLIIKEKGCYFNRQIFAFPNGNIACYDKRHLFRMGGEHEHYTAGEKNTIVTYKGWRILPQICYDLRFPVWARNRNTYDLAIYVANFPTARRQVWNTLLAARAIENQCFLIGCNRIGTDANGHHHSGDTQILSPKGEIIVKATENKAETISAVLDFDNELQNFREKFPVHLDADDFKIKS